MRRLLFGLVVGCLIGYPFSYLLQNDMLKMTMTFMAYCTDVCSVLFNFSNRMNGANSVAYVTTGISAIVGAIIAFLTIPKKPSIFVWFSEHHHW